MSTGTKINGASIEEDAKGLSLYLNKPKQRYVLEIDVSFKHFWLAEKMLFKA